MDFVNAAEYYRMLADQGNADAQRKYSRCLENGFGLPPNRGKAAEYCKLAADQGHSGAQYTYGRFLEMGIGLTKDQSNSFAQHDFGWWLEQGLGGEKDFMKALEYYKGSANQGNSAGQYVYGRFLAHVSVFRPI
jgi:TPR repeat protein